MIKSILKKLLTRPLASPLVSRFATRFFGCGVPVFLLHRITDDESSGGITANHLRRCLQYLVDNGYQFISLETLLTAVQDGTTLPDKSVVFTMDDGFIDQADIAAPIFLDYDCPLTFFIISGLVDGTLWPWDAQISWIINHTEKTGFTIQLDDGDLTVDIDPANPHAARELVRNNFKELDADSIPELITQLEQAAGVSLPTQIPDQYRAIDWQQARALERQGVRFAPHTTSHRILSKLDSESARNEIMQSWQRLRDELAQPLNVFCYPTGRRLDFGPREINILKQTEFIGAVSTMPGYVEPCKDSRSRLFSLPRFELPTDMNDFIQYCSWIEHAKHAES